MRRPVRLLPQARAEFDEAVDWYDDRGEGLGKRFITQVRQVFDQIAADPERHAPIHLDIRKALASKFPYAILYRTEGEEVVVISVFHTSRDPSAWKSRA